MDIRGADPQPFRVGQIFPNIPLRNLLNGDPFFVGFVDELVVDVGEVLDKSHVIAAIFKVPAQGIKHANRAGVANMDKVIDGRAAGVHFDLARLDRDELLFLSGEGVVNFHADCSFIL